MTNKAILEVLKQHNEGLSSSKIAEEIKLTVRATRTRLIKLIELGLVTEIASSSQDPYRLYFSNYD